MVRGPKFAIMLFVLFLVALQTFYQAVAAVSTLPPAFLPIAISCIGYRRMIGDSGRDVFSIAKAGADAIKQLFNYNRNPGNIDKYDLQRIQMPLEAFFGTGIARLPLAEWQVTRLTQIKGMYWSGCCRYSRYLLGQFGIILLRIIHIF